VQRPPPNDYELGLRWVELNVATKIDRLFNTGGYYFFLTTAGARRLPKERAARRRPNRRGAPACSACARSLPRACRLNQVPAISAGAGRSSRFDSLAELYAYIQTHFGRGECVLSLYRPPLLENLGCVQISGLACG
jgi:hypothetical protein